MLASQPKRMRLRQLQALLCLFGLVFFYAPIMSATLMAATSMCCSTDQCPIHGNHHASHRDTAKAAGSVPVNCSHHGHDMSKMNSCSMSCCQTTERPAIHAHIFVPAPAVSLAWRAALSNLAQLSEPKTNSLAFAPPAPPPKSLVS